MSLPRQRHRLRPVTTGTRGVAWGAVGFALVQLALALATETALPEVARSRVRRQAAPCCARVRPPRRARTPTIVMVGSSRVEYGFLGRTLEQQLARTRGPLVAAFNFGMAGAGPVTEHLVVRRLLAAGIRPDLLLLEVLAPVLTCKIRARRPEASDRGPPLSRRIADRGAAWPGVAGAARCLVASVRPAVLQPSPRAPRRCRHALPAWPRWQRPPAGHRRVGQSADDRAADARPQPARLRGSGRGISAAADRLPDRRSVVCRAA